MKIENIKKLVANLHDNEEYALQLINLKQALDNGLILKKVDRVIKINQKSWLKPYIDMNTDLKMQEK